MIELAHTTVELNGIQYEIIPFEEPIDVSEGNEVEHPTFITHIIKGFGEDVCLSIEVVSEKELTYEFMYFVGDTGLIISIADEAFLELASAVLQKALNGASE